MSTNQQIVWNDSVRLILSDVDETLAEVYVAAEPAMIAELTSVLKEGIKIFMVTGGSVQRVTAGITDLLPAHVRSSVLIAHCSGAEVWGFDDAGALRTAPFYSVYEGVFSDAQKRAWREVVDQLVSEFQLRTHAVRPKVDFWEHVGRDPLDIMLDDRGPQITLEIVNGVGLTDEQVALLPFAVPAERGVYDMRTVLMRRATELLAQHNVPVTARLGGNFALDLAIEGTSKTSAIQRVLEDDRILATIGLNKADVMLPKQLEIWGDKFSVTNGGTDRHMSEAVDAQVRSIDFRNEDPEELPQQYNIVLWQGEQQLHHGVLEYLRNRHE